MQRTLPKIFICTFTISKTDWLSTKSIFVSSIPVSELIRTYIHRIFIDIKAAIAVAQIFGHPNLRSDCC